MSTDTVLQLKDLVFGYDTSTDIIQLAEFTINRGESVFLRGPSGSGKSTLLGLIGGVLKPNSGQVEICGTAIGDVPSHKRDALRADHLGIIFQQLNLLPYLDIVQNVTLPCRFSKIRAKRAIEETGSLSQTAQKLVSDLGIPMDMMSRNVGKLSIGQQQRVAVARALIGGPDLIIADEPTSALDTDNRDRFIELLDEQRKRYNCALLFVSHDLSLSKHFDRAVSLSDINRVAL
jgi:putative ABC transport system ATP-binding protein